MRIAFVFIILVFPSILFAQLPESLLDILNRTTMISYKDYEGSVYKPMRYSSADILDEQSGTYTGKLRYDIFSDHMEYKDGSSLYTIRKKQTINIRLGDNHYYYCTFKDQRGLNKEGYYVMVALHDEFRIYKKQSTIIKHPKTKERVVENKGSIRVSTAYYLEENGVLLELPLKKEDLLSVLSDKTEELDLFMTTEKIKPKKEKDLVRLVNKYQSLKNVLIENNRSMLTKASKTN